MPTPVLDVTLIVSALVVVVGVAVGVVVVGFGLGVQLPDTRAATARRVMAQVKTSLEVPSLTSILLSILLLLPRFGWATHGNSP